MMSSLVPFRPPCPPDASLTSQHPTNPPLPPCPPLSREDRDSSHLSHASNDSSDMEMDFDPPTPGGGGRRFSLGAPAGLGLLQEEGRDDPAARRHFSSGGHIDAFLRQQRLETRRAAGSADSPVAGPGDERGGDRAGDAGRLSPPRAVSAVPAAAWQFRLHLQNTVMRLEKGLTSQVPSEIIEAEVQVRRAPCPDSSPLTRRFLPPEGFEGGVGVM